MITLGAVVLDAVELEPGGGPAGHPFGPTWG